MEKNISTTILIILILVITAGLGYYMLQKGESTQESSKVQVDSTGGKLTITETPVNQPSVTEQKENITTPSSTPEKNMNKVTIDTNFGKIVLELYTKDAPKAANNFATLASKGFYNNLIFHRVIPGFMIQGGDPLGTGRGGPGYQFEDGVVIFSFCSVTEGWFTGVSVIVNFPPVEST
jgi:hypothetical protein